MSSVKRHGKSNQWEDICLFDQARHFRGIQAVFETEGEARAYMSFYDQLMNSKKIRKGYKQKFKVFDDSKVKDTGVK